MRSTTDEPTQAEIETLSKRLIGKENDAHCGDLCVEAALMIARLERLWLETRKS